MIMSLFTWAFGPPTVGVKPTSWNSPPSSLPAPFPSPFPKFNSIKCVHCVEEVVHYAKVRLFAQYLEKREKDSPSECKSLKRLFAEAQMKTKGWLGRLQNRQYINKDSLRFYKWKTFCHDDKIAPWDYVKKAGLSRWPLFLLGLKIKSKDFVCQFCWVTIDDSNRVPPK